MKKTAVSVVVAMMFLSACQSDGNKEPEGVKHSVKAADVVTVDGKPPTRAVETWNSMSRTDQETTCDLAANGKIGDVLAQGIQDTGDVDLAKQWAAVLATVCPTSPKEKEK